MIRQRDLTFPYGSQKVRGVNLGGWFVLERKHFWLQVNLSSKADILTKSSMDHALPLQRRQRRGGRVHAVPFLGEDRMPQPSRSALVQLHQRG